MKVVALAVACAWLTAIGCGGGKGSGPTPNNVTGTTTGSAGAGSGTTAAAGDPVTPTAFCDRFATLKTAGCPVFNGVDMTRDDCLKEYTEATKDPDQGELVRQTGRCVVTSPTCQDVAVCIQALAPKQDDLRACTEDVDSGKAVGLPKAEFDKRNGVGVTKFSQAKSTKDTPIEVCSIPAENQWLTTLACNDGSRPLHDNAAAEGTRVGNVGGGGRCGSIIDHYRVPCPEAAYDIYIDGYICSR